MSTYAIGDLQGCAATFAALRAEIRYRPKRDAIWLAGDLVNRGPSSLEVLRWARARAAACVLGNHDLHLLAVVAGVRSLRRKDTLQEVLDAPDLDELVDWLRRQPLLHCAQGHAMVHAGLHPDWSLEIAQDHAERAQRALSGPNWQAFLAGLYDPAARAEDPLLQAVHVMTMVRLVDEASGAPQDTYKGNPSGRPEGTIPWFEAPERRWAGSARVLHGHWAALGLQVREETVGLDSGCAWGGQLSALRLEDGAVFQAAARG